MKFSVKVIDEPPAGRGDSGGAAMFVAMPGREKFSIAVSFELRKHIHGV